MDRNNIFTEALYGVKNGYRSALFRIVVILVVCGSVFCQFIPLFGEDYVINYQYHSYVGWISQALPSSMAYRTAYFFNIIQLLLVIAFVNNDLRSCKFSGMESIRVRPFSNEEIVLGNFLGKLLLFTLVNFLTLGISILINATFYPHAFDFGIYLFYWLTLNLPALVFFLGVSFFVIRVVRQQALSFVILSVFFWGLIFWGAGWLNGLFDPCARHIPNMFSDFTGHVGMGNYLLQRSFIFFTGISCLLLSIIPYPRIPNRVFGYRSVLGRVCVIFVFAACLGLWYMSLYNSVGNNREKYKRIYSEYEKFTGVKVVQNDLQVKALEENGISVTSRMIVENRAPVPLPLVMYLNPGLKILSLEIDGNRVDFQRKQQAIVADKKLEAGEMAEVLLRYEGGIEKDICFLDVIPEKYYSETINNYGIYYFGNVPAFCERDYKLFTPECMWYPVCVPLYGVSGLRDVNFSRYSLQVEHEPRLKAISQGSTVQEKEGVTIFAFEHNMPGISLCVGNYERREITVDSTRMALYYFPRHDYLLEEYEHFSEECLLDELAYAKSNTFELSGCIRTRKFSGRKRNYDPTQQYPYRWLTLVEVPCGFYSFPSLMQLSGERVQGGMVFLPEKGFSIKNYPGKVFEDETKDWDTRVGMKLSSEISESIGKGSCNIKPQLVGKTTFIYSREYPLIHDVLMRVAREEGIMDDSRDYMADYGAIEYLKHASLKDALGDSTLEPEILQSIIRKKCKELRAYIALQVGKEQFRQFYVDFLGKYLFEEVSLEDFLEQFSQTFDFRLDSLVENCYNTNRLAILDVRDARVIEVKKMDDVLYRMYEFKVFNKGDVAGIIMWDKAQGWVIPPRMAMEIHVGFPYNGANPYLEMPLAQNIPSVMYLKEIEMSQVDTTTRVFQVDTSLFYTKKEKEEIIVDNEDSGFRLVKAKDNFITSLFQKGENDKRYYNVFIEDAWLPVISKSFYGFPIRSALYKAALYGAGSGKQKVEWNVVLPQEGKYEVFFYYTEYLWNWKGRVPQVKELSRHYSVFDGKKEYEVTPTLTEEYDGSWVSLGVYDFSRKAKVTLSDRVPDSEIQQTLVADAVKWVRVE